MILVALIIGVILVVAAIRNSQGALFNALGQDVPGFVVWAAALFAVGAVGFIPGLKPVSRGLMALVLIVIVLNNYQAILNGFGEVAKAGAGVSTGSATDASGTVTANDNSSVANSMVSSLLQSQDFANSFGAVAG